MRMRMETLLGSLLLLPGLRLEPVCVVAEGDYEEEHLPLRLQELVQEEQEREQEREELQEQERE